MAPVEGPSGRPCVERREEERLLEELSRAVTGSSVVVGIGNDLMGDDGAGPAVARRLLDVHPERVFDAASTPENFVAPIRRAAPDTVVLVDAADFGGAPGEVRVASEEDVAGLMMGTHAAPLSMFMRVIGEETGASVVLIAIQAESSELGAKMGESVRSSVEQVATRLSQLLNRRTTK